MDRLINAPFLIFLLFLLASASAKADAAAAHIRLDLLRSLDINDNVEPTKSRAEHYRALVLRDTQRQREIKNSILSRTARRRTCETQPNGTTSSSSFQMPLRAAAYVGNGEYFVRFRVGTPAQSFLLVADTGSDLTWINCKYRSLKPMIARRKGASFFNADGSHSFVPVSCSSEMCKTVLPFSLAKCPSQNSPCAYDYRYTAGSKTLGFYANESATVTLFNGERKKLKGLIIGCSQSSIGNGFTAADGVLGLGYSQVSFANSALSLFGNKFSYCLVDHLSPKNVTGFLVFGPNPAVANSVLSTPLNLDQRLEPFYGVYVTGIYIDDKLLPIPSSAWATTDENGVIVDSGSSLTSLVDPAYKIVVAELSKALEGVKREEIKDFDYCYDWTTAPNGTRVPKFAIEFKGSVKLQPPVKSYLIDYAEGIKCLGFVPVASPGISIIGNIIQQEYVWEYDVKNQVLSFQQSTCTH